MPVKWRVAIPVFFSCALGIPAPQAGSPESAATATDRGWSELTSSMEKMHHSMRSVTPSGDTDVDFVRLMLPHHQAAIDMARTELLLGRNPELRRLAQEIITDQQSEIDLMKLWLEKHASSRHTPGNRDDSTGREK